MTNLSPEWIIAAARAMWDHQFEDGHWDETGQPCSESAEVCLGHAERALTAVLPLILAEHEKQVREQCAAELNAWAEETGGTKLSGPQAVRRRSLEAAARKIAPKPSLAEVAAAINRGDFAGCFLDDAGRSIVRDDTTGGQS